MGGCSLCRCQCPRESLESCHPSLAVKGCNQPGYHDANGSSFAGDAIRFTWMKTPVSVVLCPGRRASVQLGSKEDKVHSRPHFLPYKATETLTIQHTSFSLAYVKMLRHGKALHWSEVSETPGGEYHAAVDTVRNPRQAERE